MPLCHSSASMNYLQLERLPISGMHMQNRSRQQHPAYHTTVGVKYQSSSVVPLFVPRSAEAPTYLEVSYHSQATGSFLSYTGLVDDIPTGEVIALSKYYVLGLDCCRMEAWS